jgi:hypothetical protein
VFLTNHSWSAMNSAASLKVVVELAGVWNWKDKSLS